MASSRYAVYAGGFIQHVGRDEKEAVREAKTYIEQHKFVEVHQDGKAIHKWINGEKIR
jgi:hypothetical protein